MQYSEMAELYERLEATPKKLEKRDIIADFIKGIGSEDLPAVMALIEGRVFPPHMEEDLGVALKMMQKAVSKSTGANQAEIVKLFSRKGDMGLVAEHFVKNRKQSLLMARKLDVEKTYGMMKSLAYESGTRSQDRKLNIVAGLLSSASPKEARYITRTVLGELRIGVAEGIIRDAISQAFGVSSENVEHAYNMTNDFGEVADTAKTKGDEGLLKADIRLGRPLRVMLAERSPGLKEAIENAGEPAIETKLDGFRAQIHKSGDKVTIFSRRLEDVTGQFPEIAERAKKALECKECVIEGEVIAVDPKTGKARPFQNLSQRIQRKYDIEKMRKEIPVRIELFDVIYIDGENIMCSPLRDRWKILNDMVKPIGNKFVIVDHIETKDLKKADGFYKRSLEMGEEGVMVKNLDSEYRPGKRVGLWYKVKPVMETLDLVVTSAKWGQGKRAKWFSSLTLSARNHETGNFLETGKMASGLTEEQLEAVTGKLKELITKEKGTEVDVKPRIVLEIAYEEIQKSPKYPSGFALRFPRLVRFRDDKEPDEADSIDRIEHLYAMQKGKGS